MIVVVADDFTGAAEIGGVALRNGYRVAIDTEVGDGYGNLDVVVLATDTRGMTPQEARNVTAGLVKKLMKLKPQLIYKKIDSVLRGNILVELSEHMRVAGRKKALVVPANPSLQRIIKDGAYYYHGLPLDKSDFAASLPSQLRSSNVVEMLGGSATESVSVVTKDDSLPTEGVFIANTENESDLAYWASKVEEEMVVVGASGFFNALLQQLNLTRHSSVGGLVRPLGKRVMYICGSAFPASREAVELARETGRAVAYMPSDLLSGNRNQLLVGWKDTIVRELDSSGCVIVAIDEIDNGNRFDLPAELGTLISQVVDLVLRQTTVDELVIEGGATAAAVLQLFQYSRLYPVEELATGVIRMKVASAGRDLYITMKPGSYVWPTTIWPYPVNV
jgi:uncharacterized protein YgbK (DUF1537 family)